MKILNPTVFLKDGELFCLTTPKPEEPDEVDGAGDFEGPWENYAIYLDKAKSSAVKVKNKHSTESYIWLNEDGFMSCCNKRTACGQDRRATCAGTLKEGKLYTLSGYEAEVVKLQSEKQTENENWVFDRVATITPISNKEDNTVEEPIWETVINAQIERCKSTIERFQGDENAGVRIQAQSKIIMLEEIKKDIREKVA